MLSHSNFIVKELHYQQRRFQRIQSLLWERPVVCGVFHSAQS